MIEAIGNEQRRTVERRDEAGRVVEGGGRRVAIVGARDPDTPRQGAHYTGR